MFSNLRVRPLFEMINGVGKMKTASTKFIFLQFSQWPRLYTLLTIITLTVSLSLSPSSQDRLLYLDIAEDFLAKAKRFYPPKDDSDEEMPGLNINLPLLLARVEAMNGGGDDDEDESDRDDGNLSDRS